MLSEFGGGFPRRLNITGRPIANQVPRGKGEKDSEKRVKSARKRQGGSVREELKCSPRWILGRRPRSPPVFHPGRAHGGYEAS